MADSGDKGRQRQVQARIEKFQQDCGRAGLRVTPQRTAVFRALIETDDHPSADVVFRRVRQHHPHVSLDTVNRTLHTLSRIGAAFVVEGTGEPKRFDGNLDNHQHFRCVRCRKVVDFHAEQFDDISVPTQLSERFKILRSTVYFEGICDECATAADQL